MNKLTLVSMAILCLLLSSCADRLSETDSSDLTQLETRSANLISAILITPEGVSNTILCTRVEVNYENVAASALVTYTSNTTASYSISELRLSVPDSYVLDVLAGGDTFEADDLNIDICESALCYSDLAGTNIGSALDFIIEDNNEGF